MCCLQLTLQVKNISVQSSVSLQHLPYDKHLEKNVEASIAGRLAFATQKLEEIVKAAQDAPALKQDQQRASLPNVGEQYSACPAILLLFLVLHAAVHM